MPKHLNPSNPTGWRALTVHPIEPDEPILWGCSGKGWHCCTGKVIPLRPYDLVRMRHGVGRPAHEIVNDGLVTFVWDQAGSMWGYLAQVPFERGRPACVFYEQVTNVRAREIRDEDPERFAGLPEIVRHAAESNAAGEWRVAGLCRIHLSRPEACRGFPFQRDPMRERREHDSPFLQVYRCGTCALATPTTPRAVMDDNDLVPYWRADDVFLETCRYLQSRGAAETKDPTYRALPIPFEQRAEIWASMYAPDTAPEIVERYPEQWRAPVDVEGDNAIYRFLVERAIDRVDAAVADLGLDPADLGPAGRAPRSRPDFDALFAPGRELLMPVVRAQVA